MEVVPRYFFALVLFGLACIWFGDDWGARTGWTFAIGSPSRINSESPGCVVKFLGWLFFLGAGATLVYCFATNIS